MKLVYRAYTQGRWYIVVSQEEDGPWYHGYMTVTKEEAESLRKTDYLKFVGKAKDADLAGELDPDQLIAGVDTADPGNEGMAVAIVLNRLGLITDNLDRQQA